MVNQARHEKFMAINELKDTKGEVKRLQLLLKKTELSKEVEKRKHAEMVK